jgi:2-methylcitrate dehydratase PrpD
LEKKLVVDANQLLAQFIAETRWEHLPAAVQEKARMCLVDNLGATLAGTLTRVSRICADYAQTAWMADSATILLHGKRSSAAGAAFANAAAANGIDSDDSVRYAWGHGGAQIFPVALALAEGLGLNGARLLAATVVGYEVAHRIGGCWHEHHREYQACGSWGSVASAAVAANLMGLTPEQTTHALGIAEYHSPNAPMMRDVDHPAMVKHAIPWGSMTGIIAAELALRGFTGIPLLFGEERYHDWIMGIGDEYLMLDGVAWKVKGYACCGWAHAGVEGARELVADHEIAIEEIERIVVDAFSETVRLGTKLPSTTEEAQFNLAWPLAAMLVDGEVGPRQTKESRLGDPKIRSLAKKVEVVESEVLNQLCRLHAKGDPRGRFASIVTIKLKDGREYCSGMKDGSMKFPAPAWTREMMGEKFHWLAANVLDSTLIEEVLEIAWHLDEIGSIEKLMARLR